MTLIRVVCWWRCGVIRGIITVYIRLSRFLGGVAASCVVSEYDWIVWFASVGSNGVFFPVL